MTAAHMFNKSDVAFTFLCCQIGVAAARPSHLNIETKLHTKKQRSCTYLFVSLIWLFLPEGDNISQEHREYASVETREKKDFDSELWHFYDTFGIRAIHYSILEHSVVHGKQELLTQNSACFISQL